MFAVIMSAGFSVSDDADVRTKRSDGLGRWQLTSAVQLLRKCGYSAHMIIFLPLDRDSGCFPKLLSSADVDPGVGMRLETVNCPWWNLQTRVVVMSPGS